MIRQVNPRMTISEHAEQSALFEWVALMASRHEAFESIFAIPNGGYRHKPTAMMLQREGVRAGVPDVFLAYPSRGKHGLFVEMKRADGSASDVRQTQWEWLERLEKNGYQTVVCYGEREARQAICDYLGIADAVID